MTEIYEEITAIKRNNRACALATIVQASGSTPQRAGAKMLVRDDGSTAGTLGGGCIEEEVRQLALSAIGDRTPRTVPFDLTGIESGLVCGGHMVVFIEPVLPDPALVVIGGGHVGKAISTVARFCHWRTTVIDDREEYANPANLPDATKVIVNDFSDPLRGVAIGMDTSVVVATRGHVNDREALEAVLRTPAGYIGLVGSKRKKAVIFGILKSEGFGEADIERVTIPAGVPIGSVTPEEIAVSIMAQVIGVWRGDKHGSCCDSSCGRLVGENGAVETAPSPR